MEELDFTLNSSSVAALLQKSQELIARNKLLNSAPAFLSKTINKQKEKWDVPIICKEVKTKLGKLLLSESDGFICQLEFISSDRKEALNSVEKNWPDSKVSFSYQTDTQLPQNIKLLLKGTEFQIKVWQTLLHLPPDTIASYSQIAQLIKNTEATRAVASAVASNKTAILIPCHRVVNNNGLIGKYRWGNSLKTQLIKHNLQNSAF